MSSSLAASTSASHSVSASASASTGAHGLSVGSGNSSFKIVGVCLAVGSGFFIGSSFVVKKKGLLRATKKAGNASGEGHAYLKDWIWWTGMIMMIIGEILNFVAYAFTEAVLVTPMGALSVVICAILSHFFLKESLNFFGWIGCSLCIIGATILALNVPEQQSVTTIIAFRKLFLSPGFLVWGSLSIAISIGIVFFVAPRWGKTNMMPYIAVCSLIGGISVSCTQGLGASIVTSIQGDNQVKNWFFWFLLVFVVVTLLVEINYLNKALELFNAAMVVPVYFVTFTSATLITSFILYKGLKASAITLITMVLGFLVICLGITLLQLSKVDPKQLTKLDRRATIFLEAAHRPTEESEKGNVTAMEEPGMDALRGGFGAVGSIIRARSISRRMSSASSLGKYGGYSSGNNLSTHGLGHLERFQLSDNPMPNDALDQVSLHSKSPIDRSFPFSQPFGPQRKKSTLTFEEADVVHQYGYGREDESTHHYRQHPHSAPPLSMLNLATPRKQSSGSSAYPPVMEEPEELDDDLRTGQKEKDYLDPYYQSSSSRLSKNPSKISTQTGHSNKFSNMFNFSHSSNPESPKYEVRGGGHRGVRDYPSLKPKDYAMMEQEERAALVDDRPTLRIDSDWEGEQRSGGGHYRYGSEGTNSEKSEDGYGEGRRGKYEEPISAATDESFGHVFKAERLPAPTHVGGRIGDGDVSPRGSRDGIEEEDEMRTPRVNDNGFGERLYSARKI